MAEPQARKEINLLYQRIATVQGNSGPELSSSRSQAWRTPLVHTHALWMWPGSSDPLPNNNRVWTEETKDARTLEYPFASQ